MKWGTLELDQVDGPAAMVLVREYERCCREYGKDSQQVKTLTASELGFEHNLGLLHKAHYAKDTGVLRMGVPESQYYLERCLLEAEGSSMAEKGALMCASIVGHDAVRDVRRGLFGKSVVSSPAPGFQVPELWLHPATTVGADADRPVSKVGIVGELDNGFCYLALLDPACKSRAAELLGPCPKLVDLLDFGLSGSFLPEKELSRFNIWPTGAGYHVGISSIGQSFLDVVRTVVNPDSDGFAGAERFSCREELGVGADPSDVLCRWLSDMLGSEVRLSAKSLELVTCSAALLDADRKKRLRSLEAMGDSVLSMVLARDNYLRGEPVERYQTVRSDVTSNRVLSEKFIKYVPKGAVAFLPNVNPGAGVTGAKALESILGAVWLDLGDQALSTVLEKMEFMKLLFQSPDIRATVGHGGGGGAVRLFEAFRSNKHAVDDALAYQRQDEDHNFVTPGIKFRTVFTDWGGPELASDAEFVLVGNRASYYAAQYANSAESGMAMLHLLVIPRQRWFNAVSLGDGGPSMLDRMQEFFRRAWLRMEVRQIAYRHQEIAVMAVRIGTEASLDALQLLVGNRDRLLALEPGDFDFGLHLFPTNSVGHLHMHVLGGPREYSTRVHDAKTFSVESVKSAILRD